MIDNNNNIDDVSSNDVDVVSGNDSVVTGDNSGSNENSDNENTENENLESTIIANNTIDYSYYFENLQTIGIFICGLLVAYGVAFAFFKGFKK